MYGMHVWSSDRRDGMGGLLVIIHDSIYGQVVRQRSLRMLAFMLACECQFSWLASSLCRSYEAKSLQMKEERILREYFLVLENLLCNYEGFLRKRSALLLLVTQHLLVMPSPPCVTVDGRLQNLPDTVHAACRTVISQAVLYLVRFMHWQESPLTI